MAKEVVPYESAKALQGLQVSDEGAQAWERAGRNIGGAIDQAGNALQRNLDLYDQHETMDQQAQMTNQFVTADQNIEKAKNDALSKNLSPSEFVDSITPDLDKIEDTATTDRAKQYYQAKRAQIITEASKDYTSKYGAMAGDNLVNSLKASTTNAAKTALTDPTQTQAAINSAMLDNRYAMDHSDAKLSPQQRANAEKDVASTIADAGAEGYLRKLESGEIPAANAGKVSETLMDPKGQFYPNMSLGKLNEVTQRLAKLQATNDGTAAQIAAQALPAIHKQMEANGGYDVGGQGQAIINNLPVRTPEQQKAKAEAQRNFDDAAAAGRATKGAMSLPQDQLTAGIQSLDEKRKSASADEVDGLNHAYDAAVKAQKERDAAFHSDPSGWLTNPGNNATIAASYNAWKQHPDAKTLNTFVTQSMGEQARLYPNQPPSVLTAEMKSHIGDQVAQAKTSEGGAAATAQVLQANAAMFGPRWTQAAQELHHSGMLNDTQFLAASLYGDPSTVGLGTKLIQASFQNSKDLEANSGTSEEKATAAAAAALKPLAQSLSDSISGQETVAGYTRGLGRLLLSISHDAGSDQTQAQAAKLAQQMVLSHYTFVPNGGGQIRVPVSARLSATDVSHAADAYTVNSTTLVVPPSYSGLGPKDQAQSYIDSLRSHGRWVTNSDETGMRLLDWSGNAASEMKGGKQVPIEIKWKDVKPAPATVFGIEVP
jgi:hypothetical protein